MSTSMISAKKALKQSTTNKNIAMDEAYHAISVYVNNKIYSAIKHGDNHTDAYVDTITNKVLSNKIYAKDVHACLDKYGKELQALNYTVRLSVYNPNSDNLHLSIDWSNVEDEKII